MISALVWIAVAVAALLILLALRRMGIVLSKVSD